MDRTQKGTIAVIVIAIIVFFAVYGSYLPMRKSEIYIATLASLSTPGEEPTSIQDFEARVSTGLDYTSPIGQEELVRNTASNLLGLMQQVPDASTTNEFMDYMNGYLQPILERGKGMSFGQDVYIAGTINQVAYTNTGDPKYIEAALSDFEFGHELGPNRPQSLYGFFSTYEMIGDATGTKMVGEEILKNWPDDTRIQAALQEIASSTKSGNGLK